MNFTHSSRKSWALLRKLGEATQPPKLKYDVDPNKLASQIKQNSSKCSGDRYVSREVKAELRRIKLALQHNEQLDRPFDIDEMNLAIELSKVGKAAGPDGFYTELNILKNGPACGY